MALRAGVPARQGGVCSMKKGAAAWFLLAGLGCVAVFSAFQLARAGLEYRTGRRSYAALEQYAPAAAKSGASAPDGGTATAGADFDALRQIDENVVAWLHSPGTSINYPVVQAEDNEYYLTHMFGRQKNSAGAIFLDAGCSPDFSDTHTIIYGHHMKNDTMFSSLTGYLQPGYYEQHQTLALYTPQGDYTIRVFAGYVAAPDGDAWQRAFSSQQEFAQWCARAAQRSAFQSGVLPQEGQRIVTLSTCSYEFENARFVLLGILEQASQ